MNYRFLILGCLVGICGISQAQTQQLTTTEVKSLYSTAAGSVYSIHDPSVVYKDGKFTIFGSHMGTATSSDLMTWTANSENWNKVTAQGASTTTSCGRAEAFVTQRVNETTNYKGQKVAMKNFNALAYCSHYNDASWINGNCWAPDIIYNTTMKKWCMYLSLNGPHWNSIIIMLSSNSSTGPFTYEGPVVMGGFNGQTYDGIAAPTVSMTDLELATGETTLPDRYRQAAYGSFWPNCIDPCVFYDEQGELWMSYGSWSGGIFMLKLDKTTGLRDYTVTYENQWNLGANGLSDPYFGKKIAGGHYVSGEASYIQHIGNYYYLFMTYGGLGPSEGYEMRIFRSENPDGPYKDGSGTLATYTGYQLNFGPGGNNRGMKITGAYNNWGNQNVGQTAEGHNSACADGKGRNFVMYHTKFNDGTAGHQIRAHQLFVNEKGWLVQGPFCYRGETTTDDDIKSGCPWTADEIAGDYHVLIHPYNLDHKNMQEATPGTITLTADGKVKGDYTGTWSLKDGTAYVTLKLGTTYYYGVMVEQEVNGATKSNYRTTTLKALAISAVSNAGVPVWAYKLQPEYAISYNYLNNTINVKNGVTYSKNISLMFPTVENTTLEWTSSAPSIISETGKYNPTGLESAAEITLTGRLICGDYYWEQAYNVKAQKEITPSGDYRSGLVAYYDFDTTPQYNAYNDEQRAFFQNFTTGTKPALEEDYDRFGKVLHQYQGDMGSNSYVKMTNPLYGATELEGMTISMWVKRSDANMWDGLWCFFSGTTAKGAGSRAYLTGNNYLCFNDNNGNWFDINKPVEGSPYADIPVGEWQLVTVTVGAANGVAVYVNGTKKTPHTVAASEGTTVKTIPYGEMLKQLASLKYLYLGMGSFNGSADACYDDLMVYNRELSSGDVRALNSMANRVCDFGPGGETAIDEITAQGTAGSQTGVFDLSGRRHNNHSLQHGIYIVNGQKVVR